MAETADLTDIPRAGFWRRLLALTLDLIIIGTPFQIIAVVLFATTAGLVQMSGGGIVFKTCEPSQSVPENLVPPPPKDSNFATECRFSFLGLQTGQALIVGRNHKQGNTFTTVFRSYMTDPDGKPVQGYSIDGYFALSLTIYLLGMIVWRGATIGDRILRIAIIDAARPQVRGVSLLKAILRYVYMMIGVVPAFAVLIYSWLVTGGEIDAAAASLALEFLPLTVIIALAWYVWIIVQIARKRDPVYDRLAGTAVVLRSSP